MLLNNNLSIVRVIRVGKWEHPMPVNKWLPGLENWTVVLIVCLTGSPLLLSGKAHHRVRSNANISWGTYLHCLYKFLHRWPNVQMQPFWVSGIHIGLCTQEWSHRKYSPWNWVPGWWLCQDHHRHQLANIFLTKINWSYRFNEVFASSWYVVSAYCWFWQTINTGHIHDTLKYTK